MSTVAESIRGDLERVLARHPVTFAMVFGSASRDPNPDDVDLAVEFDTEVRETGLSDAYLRLLVDLERTLQVDVDLVRIRSMSPRFAHAAFEEGIVVVGTEERKEALERRVGSEAPTTADARNRVATAAARLNDGGADAGTR